MAKPTFIIKENSQKVKNHFRKVLTRDILKDICFRITGETEFICRFKDNAYSDKYFAAKKTNEGRLAILKYSDHCIHAAFYTAAGHAGRHLYRCNNGKWQ